MYFAKLRRLPVTRFPILYTLVRAPRLQMSGVRSHKFSTWNYVYLLEQKFLLGCPYLSGQIHEWVLLSTKTYKTNSLVAYATPLTRVLRNRATISRNEIARSTPRLTIMINREKRVRFERFAGLVRIFLGRSCVGELIGRVEFFGFPVCSGF